MKPRFRAWNTNSGRFAKDGELFLVIDSKNYNLYSVDCDTFRLENDNYILMQSTGFNDKNNKEIYEGDIVKFDNEIPHLVFMSYIGPEMRLWRGVAQNQPLFNDMGKVSEVIGNRYENPELMPEALKKVKEMEDELY